jgi:Glycosyl hydrolases family 35
MAHVSETIAKAQITNGGPIILYQPENEYTGACCGVDNFPDGSYMQYVEDQARNAGIVVPLINNDASPDGHNAPGTGVGAVDIYGHDNYPLGFDCANPATWPSGALPTNFHTLHEQESPTTPFSLVEVCLPGLEKRPCKLTSYSSKVDRSTRGVEVGLLLVLTS